MRYDLPNPTAGFTLAMVMFAGMRERLGLGQYLEVFSGALIGFILASRCHAGVHGFFRTELQLGEDDVRRHCQPDRFGAVLGLHRALPRKFAVEGDPLADEIAALMPGSNCGQCGMAGCAVAAKAIAEGTATATVCPPGGKALATAIAAKLGIELDPDSVEDTGPMVRPSRRRSASAAAAA